MLVRTFLNNAFTELKNKRFSVTPEEWQQFCATQGVEEEELQKEKSVLEQELDQMTNSSNDEREEKIKNIFCCNPFDPKSVENFLDFWYHNNRTLFEYLLSFYDVQVRNNSIRNSINQNQEQSLGSSPNTSGSTPPPFSPSNNSQLPQNSNSSFNLVKLLELILGVIWTPAQKLFQLLIYVWSLVGSRFPRSWSFYLYLVLISTFVVMFAFFVKAFFVDIPSIETRAESAKSALESQSVHEIKALEDALNSGFELKALTKRFRFIPILNSNPPLSYSPLESLQTIMAKIHEQDEIDISSRFPSVQAMSVSRDGTTLAISQGNNERKIQVWKRQTSAKLNQELGKIIDTPSYELKNCDDNVFSLGLDSTGKRLVTGGSKGKVCLFLDIGEKRPEPKVISTATNERIYSVSFSQNDELIAIAQADGQVVVINLQGEVLTSFQPATIGQNSNKEKLIFDVSFNQDNMKLVTAGKNGDIKLWKLDNLGELPKPEVSFDSSIPIKPLVTISPLACWNAYKYLVKEVNISCEETNKISKGNNDGMPFLKTVFRKTGELLVITENKGILSMLKYSEDNKENPIAAITLNGYGRKATGNILNGAGFDFDYNQLFTISDSLLQRWNLEEKPENPSIIANSEDNIVKLGLRNKSKNDESIVSLLTINDSNKLEAWGTDGKIAPINQKNIIENKLKKFKNARFISTQQFVTVGTDDQIWLWDIKPDPLIRLDNKISDITSIATAATSSNSFIAVGNKKGLIDILNGSSGSILKTPLYTSTDGEVSLINLSEDGKHLVSVVADKVLVWDISNPLTPSKEALNKSSVPFRGGITDIRFNDTEKNIALVTEKESNIKFFDLSGEYDKSLNNKLVLDDSGVNGVSFSQSNNLFPDLSLKQPLVAAVGTTGKIKVWDFQTKRLIAQFTSQLQTINSIEISSDGTELFLGGGDNKGGKVEKWPIPDLEKLIDKGCKWLKDYHSHSGQSFPGVCGNKENT